MMTDDQKAVSRRRFYIATENAKKVLKKGDRIRVTKCPGRRRSITFDHWDGPWIVSKSGIDDYSATTIDRLNGDVVDFCAEG